MQPQVLQSFKRIAAINLNGTCSGLEISHKYCIGITIISHQLHLINLDELVQGNSSKLINTGISAHRCVAVEEKIAVAFNDLVSLYNFTNLKQPCVTINAKANVKRMVFNPTDSDMIAVLSEDGNLTLAKVCNKLEAIAALNNKSIVSLCFSPKGKQLCVGHEDGSLSQLKLDLSTARKIPGLRGVPISILWVSTTQFLVTLLVNGNSLELTQIDVQKAPAPFLYNSLNDPFISETVSISSQTFMTILHPNCIICSSTTSGDVVVLAKYADKWEVEYLSDDNLRADLPIDNYSIGHILYFNDNTPVVISDTEKYDAMPTYIIVSQLGVIRCFSAINPQGKGEGAKFTTGLTPLNLNSIAASGPPTVFALTTQPLLPTQSSIVPPAATVSLSTTTVTPNIRTQPFAFTFNPVPSGIQPHPISSVQPYSLSQQATPTISQQFTPPVTTVATVPQPKSTLSTSKSEQVGLPIQTQIEEVKKQLTTDSVSEPVLNQFQEFQKRFDKFQAAKATHSAKLSKEIMTLKNELEQNILLELFRSEDFIHNMEKTCSSQQREVDMLKEKTLSDFAQLEYMKGIAERNKDPAYLQLLRSQTMDPTILKKFKATHKTMGFIRSQIKECRRHYHFSKFPPVNAASSLGYIRETLQNHGKVLQRLMNENNLVREKLGIRSPLEKLTDELKKTTISDPSLTFKAENVAKLKDFLKQKNIVRCKERFLTSEYNYKGGDVTRELATGTINQQDVGVIAPRVSVSSVTTSTVKGILPSSSPLAPFQTPATGQSPITPTYGVKVPMTTKSSGPVAFAGFVPTTLTVSSPKTTTSTILSYTSTPNTTPTFSFGGKGPAIMQSTPISTNSALPFPSFSGGLFATPSSVPITFTSPIFPTGLSGTAKSIATVSSAFSFENKPLAIPASVQVEPTKTSTVTTSISSVGMFGTPTMSTKSIYSNSNFSTEVLGFPTTTSSSPASTVTPAFSFVNKPVSIVNSGQVESSKAGTSTGTSSSGGIFGTSTIPVKGVKTNPSVLAEDLGVTTITATTTIPAATVTPAFSFENKLVSNPNPDQAESRKMSPSTSLSSPGGIFATPGITAKVASINPNFPAGNSGFTTTPTTFVPVDSVTPNIPFENKIISISNSDQVESTKSSPSSIPSTSDGIFSTSTKGASTNPTFSAEVVGFTGFTTTTTSPPVAFSFGSKSLPAANSQLDPGDTTRPTVSSISSSGGLLGTQTTPVVVTSPNFSTGLFGTPTTIPTSVTPAFSFENKPLLSTPNSGQLGLADGPKLGVSTLPTFSGGIFGTSTTVTGTTSSFSTGIFGTPTSNTSVTPAFTFGNKLADSGDTASVSKSVEAPGNALSSFSFTTTNNNVTAPVPSPGLSSLGFGSTTACSPTSFLSGLGSVPVATEAKNVFGGGSTFGQNVATNIFGSGGATTASPQASTFSFAPKPVTQTPVFGSSATTGSSIFGGSPTFGTAPASAAFGGSAVFGSTPLSSFTASPQASGTGSIFGGGTQSTVGFGQLAQQSATSGGFGGGNVFGGTSPFGASSPPPVSPSGSIFGGGSTSPSVGFSQLSTNTSGNTFGSGNIFGGNTTSAFGSTSPQVGGTTGSIFGGTTQSSGGSAFGSSGGNIFGGSSTFGGTSPGGGIGTFGQQSNSNVFGGGATGSAFGGGSSFGGFSSFSTPTQSTQQPAQTSPGFGGSSFSSWR